MNAFTAPILCRHCRAAIDATDNYCRRCGTPTVILADIAGPRGATGLATEPRAGQAKWWESPVVVLALLFLVLGPLALPLLWRSRRFTREWKGILTAIVIGVTAFVFWEIWYTFNRLLAPLQELHKLQGF
jgi:hypothetical protein